MKFILWFILGTFLGIVFMGIIAASGIKTNEEEVYKKGFEEGYNKAIKKYTKLP